MTDVAGVGVILVLNLEKVVSASVSDGVVAGDLGCKFSPGGSLELKSLDELIL